MKKLGLSILVLGLFVAGWAGTSDEYVANQDNPELGSYLTDLSGRSLYIFTHDQSGTGTSSCVDIL